METKNTKTGGIIGTIAAVLLCGLPGICLCLFGLLSAAGVTTYNTELGNITGTGPLPTWSGYVMLCAALILILIPIVIGFVTLRNKKPKKEESGQPLPPAA